MNDQLLRDHASRSRKTFLFWALGASFLLLLPLALLLWHRIFAESAVREKLAELEDAGVAVSGEQVNRRYHDHGRDPAENAAPVYEKAFAAFVTEGVPTSELGEALRLRSGFEPLEGEALEAIAQVIAANEAAIGLLKEATAYPYLRHNLDFTDGVNLLIPHVGQLRNGARLLAGEAIFAAEQGDRARAGEAVQTMFRMAIHLAEEPTLISHLTKIAIEGIGRSALERVLDRVELAPAVLAELRRSLRTLETGPRMKEALYGEIAFGMAVYQLLAEGEGGVMEGAMAELEGVLLPLYGISGLMARDKHLYLTLMQESVRLADLPLAERVSAKWPDDAFSANPLQGQILVGMFLPTLHRVMESDHRAITFLLVTRIALAMEEYRLVEGKFPSKLEELVPGYMEELPLDPYSGNGEFQLVRDKPAFSVRSIEVISLPRGEGDLYIQFRLPVR